MSYQLGVDLGTTFTAAAVANGHAPELLGLGQRAAQIPSVLFLAEHGFLVGEAAERRGSVDPARVAREFKRRLGDPVPILVGGSPFSAEALTAQLLRWVVAQATQQRGEAPDGLVLTHPANWGEFKLEVLRQAVVLADVGTAQWCPEPVAAAAHYAARSRVPPGAKLAVYDLGGGTFDACVVEKTADSFVILGTPEGVEHLGGADFDEALFQRVLAALGPALQDADPDDPTTTVALARLRRDCVEAKEALSSDVEVAVPVSLPGLSRSVPISRTEFESLIRPALEATIAALHRALRSAGVSPDALSGIVLVGGSSRIPLVGELLQRDFRVATALDTHPKHDVVLGAMEIGRLDRFPHGAGASTGGTFLTAPGRSVAAAGPAPAAAEAAAGPAPSAGQAASSMARPAGTSASGQMSAAAGYRREADSPGDSTALRPAASPPAPPPDQPVPAAAGSSPRRPGPVGRGPGLRRPLLVAGAVAVAAGIAVGAAVHFGGGGSSPDVTLAATSSTSALSTSSAPSAPALPRSTPLAPTELIVPMRVRGNWDLYLGDTRRDAPVRRLTEDPAAEYGEALSPDRATVIFMRDPDPSDQSRTLWVAGAAHGEDARPLFDPVPPECSAVMYRPAWNPVDASMLALPCTNQQGHWGLYLIRTDGTVVREIPVRGDAVDDPAFSPNGKQLTFWAGSRSGLDGGDLFVQAVDSDEAPRRLTHSAISGRDADPTWDSDGKSIVFRRRIVDGTAGGNNDIYRLAVNGSGKAEPLSHSPADAQDPSLSPDGTEIAYTANGAAKEWPGKPVQRVWIRDSNGKNPRLLWTKGAASEQAAPAWSRR